jgi:hypothetical protein
MVILTCQKWFNSYAVASSIGIPVCDIEFPIDWSQDTYLIVVPTRGNEEIPGEMEFFLNNLVVESKKYLICELGNCFGCDESFGSAKIVSRVLESKNWSMAGPIFSLDTVPSIDWNELNLWIQNEVRHQCV